MTRESSASRLDVTRFANAASELFSTDPVQAYPRLCAETSEPGDARVQWAATGAIRDGAGGEGTPWMHLTASVAVPLTCQRCLAPVSIELTIDRWFRFVADEAMAAEEDENAEEDVLVASREFDLHALIEDELLMEIPVTPRHLQCPVPIKLSAIDADFETAQEQRPNPFTALEVLRTGKPKP